MTSRRTKTLPMTDENDDLFGGPSPDKTNMLLEALTAQLASYNAAALENERKRLDLEQTRLRLKVEEKLKDRALAEHIAEMDREERIKDRSLSERLAQLETSETAKYMSFVDHLVQQQQDNDLNEAATSETRFILPDTRDCIRPEIESSAKDDSGCCTTLVMLVLIFMVSTLSVIIMSPINITFEI